MSAGSLNKSKEIRRKLLPFGKFPYTDAQLRERVENSPLDKVLAARRVERAEEFRQKFEQALKSSSK